MSDLDLQAADTARRHADDPALGAAEHWWESRRTQLALMPVRLVRDVAGVLAQMMRPTTNDTHGEGTRRAYRPGPDGPADREARKDG